MEEVRVCSGVLALSHAAHSESGTHPAFGLLYGAAVLRLLP